MKMRMMILLATLFAFVLAFGCSDDPPPKQDKPGEKKAEKAPAKKDKPAPADKEKKAEPTKETPAATDTPPEAGDPEVDVEDKVKTAVPDKPIEPPKQIERALAKTAVHGGLAPLDDLVAKIGSVLSPGLKALMETAVYQGLLGEIAGEM